MRPQRNIEINDKIPDEKYQNNKPDDKNLMTEIRYRQSIGKTLLKMKKLCNYKI